MAKENRQRLSPSDPNSFARPGKYYSAKLMVIFGVECSEFFFMAEGFCFVEEAKVTHMDLNWTVDFVSQKLKGSVTLTVERVDPEAAYLVSSRCLTFLTF